MCSMVIWAQVLKVGIRPSSEIVPRGRGLLAIDGLVGRGGEKSAVWVYALPSYHQPVPTPRSSPSSVWGILTFFSRACGIV